METQDILNIYKKQQHQQLHISGRILGELFEHRVRDVADPYQMSKWYKEATFVYNLKLSFDEFKDFLDTENSKPNYKHSYARRRRDWYCEWDPERSYPSTSYIRLPHHVKKVLTEVEQNNREWKKLVKDPRDQENRGYSCAASQAYRKAGTRASRRYSKNFLKNDPMNYSDKGKQIWYDPWFWD